MDTLLVVGVLGLLAVLGLWTVTNRQKVAEVDDEVAKAKALYLGKYLVEPLKTKVNRHKVFWVGRSDIDGALRIGVQYDPGGGRYFFDEKDFWQNPRHLSFKVMNPAETDALEAEIKETRKKHGKNWC